MSTDTQRRYITGFHYQWSGGANQLRPAYRFDIAPTDHCDGGGFRVFRASRMSIPTGRT